MEQVETNINTYDTLQKEEMPLVMRSNDYLKQDTMVKEQVEPHTKKKFGYVFIEVCCCALILLSILIIQSVKNTEDLQLALREKLRHNLTVEEVIVLKDYALEIAKTISE